MTLVRVEELPDPGYRRGKKNIYKLLENFLNSDMKYAEVILDDDDYSRPESARNTLWIACKRYGYPIDIKTRNGTIYLAKKEI